MPERYHLISDDALRFVMEILEHQAERDNPAAGFLLRDIDKTQARFDDRDFHSKLAELIEAHLGAK